MKHCFANSQILVMFGGLEDATYHEGVISTGIAGLFCEHAWLTWRGLLIELTLPEARAVRGYSVPTRVLLKKFLERKAFEPIYLDRIYALMAEAHGIHQKP